MVGTPYVDEHPVDFYRPKTTWGGRARRRAHTLAAMTRWDVISDQPELCVDACDGAARVRLRRPERLNAFSNDLARDLLVMLERLGADPAIRSVLLTGEGRAFSAGADVKAEFDGATTEADMEDGMRILTNPTIAVIRSMPKPVIAAVNGPAAGIGCSIALACDLVIAAESAYFLLAFANIGLTADGGAILTVAARAGLGRALTMALLAERVPAAEALRVGLADRVLADELLADETTALALRLAHGPTASYAATKRSVGASVLAALTEQLDLEATLQGQLFGSSDFAEGVAAFGQRRPPEFIGR
jgi:2-(1,2-epoxy-1,2-dihydrophenyl)acetyl-CoA isomerase